MYHIYVSRIFVTGRDLISEGFQIFEVLTILLYVTKGGESIYQPCQILTVTNIPFSANTAPQEITCHILEFL